MRGAVCYCTDSSSQLLLTEDYTAHTMTASSGSHVNTPTVVLHLIHLSNCGLPGLPIEQPDALYLMVHCPTNRQAVGLPYKTPAI